MTEHQKAIINEVIRDYCIKNHLYVCGDNADYESMLNLVGIASNWPHLVACDVFRHSALGDCDATLAMETYLTDLWNDLQANTDPFTKERKFIMTENQKAIIREAIRTYCVKYNLYTQGTNAEYENMFNLVGSVDNWPRLVAHDVFQHSEDWTWSNLADMENDLNDLWNCLQATEEPAPYTTITQTIIWHRASEELPDVSGDYFVLKCNGYYATLHYSSKLRAFNVFDGYTEEDLAKYAINVDYWAELPQLPPIESDESEG